MKLAILLASSMFALASTATQAQKLHYQGWFPPVEYDQPYTGKLTIRRLETQEEIAKLCTNSKAKIACTLSAKDRSFCHIFIANDDVIKKGKTSYIFVLRHELGHCNGWSSDHKDARTVWIDTITIGPTLPKDTLILPAYPSVVCVTPEWKPEPCKNRSITPTVQRAKST
jgi:hypothetical protein